MTAVNANEAHVRAIRERGLAITGPIETFTQPLPAFTPNEVTGLWESVFLCVKALHTEAIARQLAPHLAQNGFNQPAIAETVGRGCNMGAFINSKHPRVAENLGLLAGWRHSRSGSVAIANRAPKVVSLATGHGEMRYGVCNFGGSTLVVKAGVRAGPEIGFLKDGEGAVM